MPLPHKPPLHGYNQLSVNQTCCFSSLFSNSVDIKTAENKIIPAICECVSWSNSLQLIFFLLPNSFLHAFSLRGQVLLISILAFVNLASMLSKCTYKFNLIKGLHGKLSSSITHILLIKLCMFSAFLFIYLFNISKLFFTKWSHIPAGLLNSLKSTYNIFSTQLLFICILIHNYLLHTISYHYLQINIQYLFSGAFITHPLIRMDCHCQWILETIPFTDSITASEILGGKKWNWDMVEFIAQKIPFYNLIWKVQSS